MGYLFYFLFLVLAAYGLYRLFRKMFWSADIDQLVQKRKEASEVFEKYKHEIIDTAMADAEFCKDKIEKLKKSKH